MPETLRTRNSAVEGVFQSEQLEASFLGEQLSCRTELNSHVGQ